LQSNLAPNLTIWASTPSVGTLAFYRRISVREKMWQTDGQTPGRCFTLYSAMGWRGQYNQLMRVVNWLLAVWIHIWLHASSADVTDTRCINLTTLTYVHHSRKNFLCFLNKTCFMFYILECLKKVFQTF